jgi:hypothetical protein
MQMQTPSHSPRGLGVPGHASEPLRRMDKQAESGRGLMIPPPDPDGAWAHAEEEEDSSEEDGTTPTHSIRAPAAVTTTPVAAAAKPADGNRHFSDGHSAFVDEIEDLGQIEELL